MDAAANGSSSIVSPYMRDISGITPPSNEIEQRWEEEEEEDAVDRSEVGDQGPPPPPPEEDWPSILTPSPTTLSSSPPSQRSQLQLFSPPFFLAFLAVLRFLPLIEQMHFSLPSPLPPLRSVNGFFKSTPTTSNFSPPPPPALLSC